MRSIVLVSGGLDSSVCLKWASIETDLVLALTFDYGQRAAEHEVRAASRMCRKIGCEHRVIRLDWLAEITRTALVDREKEMPTPAADELDDLDITTQTAKSVWVPNRNGVFINIAASFAESLSCDVVVVGFNAEEMQTFPDNTPEFAEAVTRSLAYSTLNRVKVVAPTQKLTKPEIVEMGRWIDAPIDMVWSCYENGGDHCWKCESCQRLKRALQKSGNWEWFIDRRNRSDK